MHRDEPEILTLEEASKLLKVGKTTLSTLAGRRDLPACRVGREWRFVKSQLLGWVRDQAARNEERLGTLVLEAIEDGVAVVDRDLKIVNCNSSYLRLTTIPKERAIGQYCYWVSHRSKEPCPEALCPARQAFRTSEPVRKMHMQRDDEGREHYNDLVAFPMIDEDGKVSRVVEVIRDNTEIYELNRHLNWVVGFVAHELKSTLGTTMMHISALADRDLSKLIGPEKRDEMLLGTLSSLKLMQYMIRNYLTSSRAKSGQLQFRRTTVDLENDLLDPVLTDMQPILSKQRMAVIRSLSGPMSVSCDRNLMRIAINNLLNNAVKYGTEGRPIYCTLKVTETNFEVSVLNEGIGIPPGKEREIFDEFTRFNPLGVPGTGLGLFLVERIVELHGGSVFAESGYLIAGEPVAYASFRADRAKYSLEEEDERKLREFTKFILRIPHPSGSGS